MPRMNQHRAIGDDGWSEWVSPTMRAGSPYRMACCDCGLVHDMEFRVYRNQRSLGSGLWVVGPRQSGMKVMFRARRNNRSTANLRRKKTDGVDEILK